MWAVCHIEEGVVKFVLAQVALPQGGVNPATQVQGVG